MPTINQLIKYGRKKIVKRVKTKALGGCPQKRGVCLKVGTTTPKKPNSALRKYARVRFSNGVEANVYIRGEGHNLQEHSVLLANGGKTQDLVAFKLKCIRGKLDASGVDKRRQSRSRYGAKRPKATAAKAGAAKK